MEENRQKLGKAVSDVSQEIEKYYTKLELEKKFGSSIIHEEVEEVACHCCGLKEECTTVYMREVQECYGGKWLCGLCSEAVKETVIRRRRIIISTPNIEVAMEDALKCHREFCEDYNATTRLNPKLSLTLSMRELAKRSLQNRKSKLSRSISYP